MGEVKQINIKNRTYYFYNDIIDLKDFDARLWKVDKNHLKTLVFTTLDRLQFKKLMIVIVFTVLILCICVLIMQTDILKKKMEVNTFFWFCWWKQRVTKKIQWCLKRN